MLPYHRGSRRHTSDEILSSPSRFRRPTCTAPGPLALFPPHRPFSSSPQTSNPTTHLPSIPATTTTHIHVSTRTMSLPSSHTHSTTTTTIVHSSSQLTVNNPHSFGSNRRAQLSVRRGKCRVLKGNHSKRHSLLQGDSKQRGGFKSALRRGMKKVKCCCGVCGSLGKQIPFGAYLRHQRQHRLNINHTNEQVKVVPDSELVLATNLSAVNGGNYSAAANSNGVGIHPSANLNHRSSLDTLPSPINLVHTRPLTRAFVSAGQSSSAPVLDVIMSAESDGPSLESTPVSNKRKTRSTTISPCEPSESAGKKMCQHDGSNIAGQRALRSRIISTEPDSDSDSEMVAADEQEVNLSTTAANADPLPTSQLRWYHQGRYWYDARNILRSPNNRPFVRGNIFHLGRSQPNEAIAGRLATIRENYIPSDVIAARQRKQVVSAFSQQHYTMILFVQQIQHYFHNQLKLIDGSWVNLQPSSLVRAKLPLTTRFGGPKSKCRSLPEETEESWKLAIYDREKNIEFSGPTQTDMDHWLQSVRQDRFLKMNINSKHPLLGAPAFRLFREITSLYERMKLSGVRLQIDSDFSRAHLDQPIQFELVATRDYEPNEPICHYGGVLTHPQVYHRGGVAFHESHDYGHCLPDSGLILDGRPYERMLTRPIPGTLAKLEKILQKGVKGLMPTYPNYSDHELLDFRDSPMGFMVTSATRPGDINNTTIKYITVARLVEVPVLYASRTRSIRKGEVLFCSTHSYEPYKYHHLYRQKRELLVNLPHLPVIQPMFPVGSVGRPVRSFFSTKFEPETIAAHAEMKSELLSLETEDSLAASRPIWMKNWKNACDENYYANRSSWYAKQSAAWRLASIDFQIKRLFEIDQQLQEWGELKSIKTDFDSSASLVASRRELEFILAQRRCPSEQIGSSLLVQYYETYGVPWSISPRSPNWQDDSNQSTHVFGRLALVDSPIRILAEATPDWPAFKDRYRKDEVGWTKLIQQWKHEDSVRMAKFKREQDSTNETLVPDSEAALICSPPNSPLPPAHFWKDKLVSTTPPRQSTRSPPPMVSSQTPVSPSSANSSPLIIHRRQHRTYGPHGPLPTTNSSVKFVPAPRLVCIETNPGESTSTSIASSSTNSTYRSRQLDQDRMWKNLQDFLCEPDSIEALARFRYNTLTSDSTESVRAEGAFFTCTSSLLPGLLGVKAYEAPSRRWYIPYVSVILPTSLWGKFADRYELPTAVEVTELDYTDPVDGDISVTMIGDIRRLGPNINDVYGITFTPKESQEATKVIKVTMQVDSCDLKSVQKLMRASLAKVDCIKKVTVPSSFLRYVSHSNDESQWSFGPDGTELITNYDAGGISVSKGKQRRNFFAASWDEAFCDVCFSKNSSTENPILLCDSKKKCLTGRHRLCFSRELTVPAGPPNSLDEIILLAHYCKFHSGSTGSKHRIRRRLDFSQIIKGEILNQRQEEDVGVRVPVSSGETDESPLKKVKVESEDSYPTSAIQFVPAPRLVCIETNPGESTSTSIDTSPLNTLNESMVYLTSDHIEAIAPEHRNVFTAGWVRIRLFTEFLYGVVGLMHLNEVNYWYAQTPFLWCPSFSNVGYPFDSREHPITIDGVSYPNSEAYFQSMKFIHPAGAGTDTDRLLVVAKAAAYADLIRAPSRTPEEAHKLGNDFTKKSLIRPDWKKIRCEMMKQAIKAKFDSRPDLKELLLATKKYSLINFMDSDDYWGVGSNGRNGHNHIGRILMKVRSSYRNEDEDEDEEEESEQPVRLASFTSSSQLTNTPIPESAIKSTIKSTIKSDDKSTCASPAATNEMDLLQLPQAALKLSPKISSSQRSTTTRLQLTTKAAKKTSPATTACLSKLNAANGNDTDTESDSDNIELSQSLFDSFGGCLTPASATTESDINAQLTKRIFAQVSKLKSKRKLTTHSDDEDSIPKKVCLDPSTVTIYLDHAHMRDEDSLEATQPLPPPSDLFDHELTSSGRPCQTGGPLCAAAASCSLCGSSRGLGAPQPVPDRDLDSNRTAGNNLYLSGMDTAEALADDQRRVDNYLFQEFVTRAMKLTVTAGIYCTRWMKYGDPVLDESSMTRPRPFDEEQGKYMKLVQWMKRISNHNQLLFEGEWHVLSDYSLACADVPIRTRRSYGPCSSGVPLHATNLFLLQEAFHETSAAGEVSSLTALELRWLLATRYKLIRPQEADFKRWQSDLEVNCVQQGISMKHPLLDEYLPRHESEATLYSAAPKRVELVIDQELSQRKLSQPIQFKLVASSSIEPEQLVTYYGGISVPESYYQPGGIAERMTPSSYALRSLKSGLTFDGLPLASMLKRPTPMQDATFKQIVLDGVGPLQPSERVWTQTQLERFNDSPIGYFVRVAKGSQLANCKIKWLPLSDTDSMDLELDVVAPNLVPAIYSLRAIGTGEELLLAAVDDSESKLYQQEAEASSEESVIHFPLVRSKTKSPRTGSATNTTSPSSHAASSVPSSSSSATLTLTLTSDLSAASVVGQVPVPVPAAAGWDVNLGESTAPTSDELLLPAFHPNDKPIYEWPEDWDEDGWSELHDYWYEIDDATMEAKKSTVSVKQYYHLNKYPGHDSRMQRYRHYQTQLKSRKVLASSVA